MPIPWFEKLPLIGYDIDGSGEKTLAVNIFQRVKMRDILKQSYLIFYEHVIRDGETPEIIADKLYGSSSYNWIVYLCNDIVDPYYDWPLSSENLIATIRKKYTVPDKDGLEFAYQTVHHFEDKNGVVIDETTYRSLPDSERKAVSIYDFEVKENERKRKIRLLDKMYIDQIDHEMDELNRKPLT